MTDRRRHLLACRHRDLLEVLKPKDEWHFTTPPNRRSRAALHPHGITSQPTANAITDELPRRRRRSSSIPTIRTPPKRWPFSAAARPRRMKTKAAHDRQRHARLDAVHPDVGVLDADGIVREKEGNRGKDGAVLIPGTNIETNYLIEVPTLHDQVQREKKLRPVGKEDHKESAKFNFAWLTAPGTAVFFAVLLSIPMLRMSGTQIGRVLMRTVVQMKIPIPTIAFMLGLSYVTRYAGMDATLGYAFANTGALYPFFAAILGWLGVFLTGTDAGSNALFGGCAYRGAFVGSAFPVGGLTQPQAECCTANSWARNGQDDRRAIDLRATAATHQLGKEADIFKADLALVQRRSSG